MSKSVEKLLENISKEFDLEKLSKSPARFSLQKLEWFNKEYLKMMDLSEFCLRASEFKMNQTYEDKNLRIGDYVMLVDFEKQTIFANKEINHRHYVIDGQFFLIGGGRDNGEDGLECIIRETTEELEEKIILEKDKILQVGKFQILGPNQKEWEDKTIDGKEMHIYVYSVKQEDLPATMVMETSDSWEFDWYDLSEMIETNQFVTYPIWQKFCKKNDFPCFPATQNIKLQYLSGIFDKHRITTLSQVGMESECILNWQKPDTELLKWKKISLEESLQNLKEIGDFILQNWDSLAADQQDLYNTVFDKETEEKFLGLAKKWEETLKDWLNSNEKQPGNYFWPLRIALSGKKQSPSPFELLAVLPKNEIEKRLKKASE